MDEAWTICVSLDMIDPVKILGIESSCDETAASVVELQDNGVLKIHSNVIASSIDLHIQYGGVVPEIAARSHIEHMMPVVEKALSDAFLDEREKIKDKSGKGTDHLANVWGQIDGIAVTQGPGLGGSLLVGLLTARTLAMVKNKPLYAVNHVMAHPFATFITETNESAKGSTLSRLILPASAPEFPMLALIVSGGHSQLVLFRSVFDYDILGRTRDDAIGEAFDKVAKILGLPYPGGPSISIKAKEGDPKAFKFPKANLTKPVRSQFRDGAQGGSENRRQDVRTGTSSANRSDNDAIRTTIESGKYDFSFSGLKTAVLRTAQKEIGEDHTFPSTKLSERMSEAQKANIAASFQYGAVETAVDKTVLAYEEFGPKSVIIAGGVAASPELRRQLDERLPIAPIYTDMKLCTDNGAMIAAIGCFMHQNKMPTADPYTLDISPSLSM